MDLFLRASINFFGILFQLIFTFSIGEIKDIVGGEVYTEAGAGSGFGAGSVAGSGDISLEFSEIKIIVTYTLWLSKISSIFMQYKI